jgi:hypothetical protein
MMFYVHEQTSSSCSCPPFTVENAIIVAFV